MWHVLTETLCFYLRILYDKMFSKPFAIRKQLNGQNYDDNYKQKSIYQPRSNFNLLFNVLTYCVLIKFAGIYASNNVNIILFQVNEIKYASQSHSRNQPIN